MAGLELSSCWVEVAGLNIHYKCLGKGEPLILLHGGGNDWHEWRPNIAVLAKDFRVYALDLPGFGLSQSPDMPVSPSWCVSFLKYFMDALGITRTYLIGHSMGAMISIVFSTQHPEYVNKLTIIDSAGLGEIDQKVRLLLSVFKITDKLRGQRRGPKFVSGSIEDWMVIDLLPQIKCPVLIVWGQNDRYLPVSQARLANSKIPGSRLLIFPHCGHAPQRECKEEFNELIVQFLMDQGQTASQGEKVV